MQSFTPKKIEGHTYYVIPEMKETGKQFSILSLLKLISQELEKLILINVRSSSSRSETGRSQAEYLLVSNIGSMIPRYIYAPIEEVAFNLFAKFS